MPADVLAEPIGDRSAVFVTEAETTVLHLDRNDVRSAPHVERIGANYGSTMFVSGDTVFVLGEQRVFATSIKDLAPMRAIGPGLMLLPSSTPGRAWVARERGTGFVLDEVDGSGTTLRTSAQLPDDAAPQAVLGDRVVLETPDVGVVVWHLGTGATTWSSPPQSHVVAAAGRFLVWQRNCASPLCVLHVTDVGVGDDRTIPISSGGGEFFAEYRSISPSGRLLAQMVTVPDASSTPFRLRLIDLETGLMSEEEAFESANLLWSPDDKWLFLGGDGNPNRPLRWAFRIDDGLGMHRVNINVTSSGEALAVAIA